MEQWEDGVSILHGIPINSAGPFSYIPGWKAHAGQWTGMYVYLHPPTYGLNQVKRKKYITNAFSFRFCRSEVGALEVACTVKFF